MKIKNIAFVLIMVFVIELCPIISFAQSNSNNVQDIIEEFRLRLLNSNMSQEEIDEANNNSYNYIEPTVSAAPMTANYIAPGAQDFESKAVNSKLKNRYVLNIDNAPFDSYLNSNESVSMLTGGLNYQKELVNLPGRGGLDLELNLIYNSDSARAMYNDFGSLSYTVNYDTPDSDNGPCGSFSNSFSMNETNEQRYFGIGWRISLPYFDSTNNGVFFQFANGAKYKVNNTELVNYKLDDVVMSRADGEYTMTYKNGVVEKFDIRTGFIKTRTDRYGETITFNYKDISDYPGSPILSNYLSSGNTKLVGQASNGLRYTDAKLLSSIIGSFGTLNINYSFLPSFTEDGVEYKYIDKIDFIHNNTTLCSLALEDQSFSKNHKIQFVSETIVYYDDYGNEMTGELEYEPVESIFSGNYSTLSSITDAEGQITQFEYETNFTGTTLCHEDAFHYTIATLQNNYLSCNLNKITYATGGRSEYDYGGYSNYAVGEANTKFKVLKRLSYVEDSTVPLNKQAYSYVGDFSGAPVYMYNSDTDEFNNEVSQPINAEYTFYTIVETCADGETQGSKTIYTFNTERQNVATDVMAGISTDTMDEDGFNVSNYPYHLANYMLNNDSYDSYIRSIMSEDQTYIFTSDYEGNEEIYVKSFVTDQHAQVGDNTIPAVSNWGKVGNTIYLFSERSGRKINTQTDNITSIPSFDFRLLPGTLAYKNNKFYFLTESAVVCYDIETSIWSELCSVSVDSSYAFCGLSGNFAFYACGTTLYKYDITNNTFTQAAASVVPNGYIGKFATNDMIGFYTNEEFTLISTADYTTMTFGADIYPDLDLATAKTCVINNVPCVIAKEGTEVKVYYVYYNFEYNACGITYYCETIGCNGTSFEVSLTVDNTICILSKINRDQGLSYGYIYYDFTLVDIDMVGDRINTQYTYDSHDLINNEIIRVMDGVEERSLTYSYNYDDYGNLLSRTEPLYGMTSYSYSPPANGSEETGYNILTGCTRYVGTGYIQTTSYALTEDKKNVASVSEIFDGVEYRTEYTYDATYGANVTAATLYAGTSDDMTQVSQKTYEYVASNNYIAPVTVTDVGISNLDEDFSPTTTNAATTYTYYPSGMVSSSTDSAGRTTTYEYYKNNLPKKVLNADGTYMLYTYNISNLNPSVTPSNGIIASEENLSVVGYYDSNDQLIRKEITTYDSLGRTVSITDTNGIITGQNASYEYSKAGSLIKAIDANNHATCYEYDYTGRAVKVINPDLINNISVFGDTEILDSITTVDYNDVMKQCLVTLPTGIKQWEKYDDVGRLIEKTVGKDYSAVQYVKYTYDVFDNVVNEKNGQGNTYHTTRYSYDRQGRLLKTTDPMGLETSYEYDYIGNITCLETAGGSKTYYESNTLGWQLWQSKPMAGTSSRNDLTNSDKSMFSYNAAGELLRSKDRKQQVSTITYKPNTNLIQNKTTGELSVSYEYDSMGNVVSMTDATGVTGYTYDYRGRLLTKTTPDNKSISYTYTPNNDISSVMDYFGNTVNYVYNTHNQLMQIKQGSSVLVDYAYNADDSIKEKRIINSTKTSYEYDDYGRLLKLNTYVTNTPFDVGENLPCHSYEYAYDFYGNRTREKEGYTDGTTASTGKITRFTYDDNNRLTKETYNDGFAHIYTYDSNGNRSQKKTTYRSTNQVTVPGTSTVVTGVTNHTINYTYNSANELIEESENLETNTASYDISRSYTYDANGNIVSKSTQQQNSQEQETYTYDALNRMTGYVNPNNVTTTYTYNGANERVKKSSGTQIRDYYLSGDLVINESLNGINHATNLIGREIEGRYTNVTQLHTFVKNGHGDVTALYNGTTSAETYIYDGFGNIRNTPTFDNPIRYSGEYFDEETGFIYLRARYYAPSIGRFTAEDPIRDGLNWYVYCNSNPVMLVDPSGLDAIVITASGAAKGAGHTSAIYQDDNGEWYYTYWGNKAAAVLKIPQYYEGVDQYGNVQTKESMASLENFVAALGTVISSNGLSGITISYTDATYIVGDFTDSLDAAFADVNDVATNRFSTKNGLTTLADGSVIFQGHNSPYNVSYRNCFDQTFAALSKGTLATGMNVGEYMEKNGLNGGMIPNNATDKFSEIFMNDSFTYSKAESALANYYNLFCQNSPWATVWEKAVYANVVVNQ